MNVCELCRIRNESEIGYRKKQEEQEQHCREYDDELQPRKTGADFSLLLRLFPLSQRVRGGHEGGEHAVAGRVLYTDRFILAFYVSRTAFGIKGMTVKGAIVAVQVS